jgi:SAM-dependent methyltransferase
MSSTYSFPHIYDIAFDFRDVKGECDFLLAATEKHLQRKVASAVELACGPGWHAREMARRGIVTTGLDLEPAMIKHARKIADDESSSAQFVVGDMKSFALNKPADLAFTLIASFAHLLTNDDIVKHFDAIADNLSDHGIYIISTAHPRDFFGDRSSDVPTMWTETRDGITVTTEWGGPNDSYDPISEIDYVTITFDVSSSDGNERIQSVERLRRMSYQTFIALVKLSGRFTLADAYGDFDLATAFTNNSESGRFIPVLKKLR